MKLLWMVGVFCSLVYPAVGLDRNAFTFTKYDLTVRIEPEQQRLGVRGRIALRNDSPAAQRNIALQISSSLDWRSIQHEGKPVEYVDHEYISDIDHTGSLSEAIVSLPQEIPPKGTIELEIGYEGVVALDATRLTEIGVPEEKAKHSDWDEIGKSFTAVRGTGYVAWYPIATEAASFSEGDGVETIAGSWRQREAEQSLAVKIVEVTESGQDAPTILCSGQEARPVKESAGRSQQITAACSFPLGEVGAPTFVIAEYQKMDAKGATIYYPRDQQEAAEAYGDVVRQSDPNVPVVHGAGKLQIVGLPDPEAVSFVSEGMMLTPIKLSMTNAVELDIVYAQARQLVSSPRPWIVEGLAHYAQASFIEAQKGRQAALDYLNARRPALVDEEKSKAVDTDAHSLLQSPDDLYLQTKAMYVWWMLKDMGALSGSPALDYKRAEDHDPAYMQHLIEDKKRDLQWFFDDWVYHDHGLPDFHVASVFTTSATTGGFLVTIEVENQGSAGAEVPVVLGYEGGEIRKRMEVRAKSKASVRIEVPGTPQMVTVNDGSVPESDVSNNVYKIETSKH